MLKHIVAAFCAKEQQVTNKEMNSTIAFFDIVLKICSSIFHGLVNDKLKDLLFLLHGNEPAANEYRVFERRWAEEG